MDICAKEFQLTLKMTWNVQIQKMLVFSFESTLWLSSRKYSDKAFNLLYKEMFYRHVMANPKAHQMITLEQRQSSFQTYTDLFDYLLGTYLKYAHYFLRFLLVLKFDPSAPSPFYWKPIDFGLECNFDHDLVYIIVAMSLFDIIWLLTLCLKLFQLWIFDFCEI